MSEQLSKLADELMSIGWDVEFVDGGLTIRRPDSSVVYQAFGAEDIAANTCFVNGVAVDLDMLATVHRHLAWDKPE